jgi:hypothetical protein
VKDGQKCEEEGADLSWRRFDLLPEVTSIQ